MRGFRPLSGWGRGGVRGGGGASAGRGRLRRLPGAASLRFGAPAVVLLLVLGGVSGAAAPRPVVPPVDTVTPARVTQALDPGGSLSVDKQVYTPVVPPRPDVVLLVDGTGSMDPVIDNVRAELTDITDAVTRQQPDARFAVATFGDQSVDGAKAFQVLQGLTDDLAAVQRGVDDLRSDLGQYSGGPAEDWINALWQIANGAGGRTVFREGATPLVVLVGDSSSHPDTNGHTLSDAIGALTDKNARVLAVDVKTKEGLGDGLNGDGISDNPDQNNDDPRHDPGQADALVDATHGTLFENIVADQVSSKIVEGLTNLPATVSYQTLVCDPALSVTLEPATRTVTSGGYADFAERIEVADDAAQGTVARCVLQFLVDGKVPDEQAPDATAASYGRPANGRTDLAETAVVTGAGGFGEVADGAGGDRHTVRAEPAGRAGEDALIGGLLGELIGGSDSGDDGGTSGAGDAVAGGLSGGVASGGSTGGGVGGGTAAVGGADDAGGTGSDAGGAGSAGEPGSDSGGAAADGGGDADSGGPSDSGAGGDDGDGGDDDGTGDDAPVPAYQEIIDITVSDVTAPVVTVDDRTVVATGKNGATVDFDATAEDAVDGELPVHCDPASGSLFPQGTTEVTCTATDSSGNTGTDTATFEILPPPVPDEADIAVAATVSSARTYPGKRTTATFTVTNAGPRTARNIVLTTDWPKTSAAGKRALSARSECTRTAPCALAPGGRITVTQSAVYHAAVTGDIHASVSGTPRDPESDDNKASAQIRVLQPKLTLSPEVAAPGRTVLARGKNFPPGSSVRLTWKPGITAARTTVRAGADGTFEAQVLVLRKDRLGPRELRAEVAGLDPLHKPLLVVQRHLNPPDFAGRS